MYKIYLKQAWQMLKEDKVISIITILGTALAITMIMVIILTQRIKTTNIGEEVNRERTMYIKYCIEESKDKRSMSSGGVRIREYKQYLERLTVPEKISLNAKRQRQVYTDGNDIYHMADVKFTDAAFWQIFSFSFREGKPFSEEEFQSGISVAVISKSFALKLFNKTDNVTGNTFIIEGKEFKVIGIVKDVSTLCNNAYAQIWVPYTSDSMYGNPENRMFGVLLLAKNKSDFSKIKEEVRQSEIANNPESEVTDISFLGPFSAEETLLNNYDISNREPDLVKGRLRFYLTLAILLLIPAINLSGFSLFKIISRTSEIGIRKAFGADKKTVLMQVLYENFLTSIIGGIIGLALSITVINFIKDILLIKEFWVPQPLGENIIPISALISPWVFLYVFLACILLNLLSSGIPAWRASRLNIVEAIRS